MRGSSCPLRAGAHPGFAGHSALARLPPRPQNRVEVFAQATALIPYRAFDVTRSLTDRRHRWSLPLDGDGGRLLARVGVSVGRLPIYKQVRLDIGTTGPTGVNESVMLPVSWTAVGGPPLFPRMEGTLHVDPYGHNSTRLTLNAQYDPPMGALGKLIDRALMHRLAQSTMDDFIGRLSEALTADIRRLTAERL